MAFTFASRWATIVNSGDLLDAIFILVSGVLLLSVVFLILYLIAFDNSAYILLRDSHISDISMACLFSILGCICLDNLSRVYELGTLATGIGVFPLKLLEHLLAFL